jgi:hypothetical protein
MSAARGSEGVGGKSEDSETYAGVAPEYFPRQINATQNIFSPRKQPEQDMKALPHLISFGRSFLDALAFLLLWKWFVVPLGFPAVGYWHAYGLDLFIGLLIGFQVSTAARVEAEKALDDETRLGWAVTKVIAVGLVIGMAALVRLGAQ